MAPLPLPVVGGIFLAYIALVFALDQVKVAIFARLGMM
jgi:hypothetical protein